jgi:hypothetical protein
MMTESNHPDYEIDTIDELGLDRRQPIGEPQEQQDSIFSTVDDETMVKRFAKGKKRSVSNHNLAISYAHNSLQLSTPQGELIALNKISDKLHYILLKQDSRYWEFIHNIVIEHSFVPIENNPTQRGFFRYQKYQIPQGYRLRYSNCIDLLALWEEHHSAQSRFQLDLLFFSKAKWYRVKNATLDDNRITLTSVAGQIEMLTNAKVAWIYQLSEAQESVIFSKAAPIDPTVHKPGENELIDKLISKLGVEDDGKPASSNKASGIDPDALALFEQVFNPSFLPALPEELQQQVVELQIAAIKIIEHYIEQGETIVRTEIITDNQGRKISEKTVTTQRGCPRWVIEALLKSSGSSSAPTEDSNP